MPSLIPILICAMCVCVIDMLLLLFLHGLYVAYVRDVYDISGWVKDGLRGIRRFRAYRRGYTRTALYQYPVSKEYGKKRTKKDRANKKAKEGKCSVTVATLFLFVVKARP